MILGKSLKIKIGEIFAMDEHPHRISLAFAIGIFISFSPIPGIQTVLAIAVAWLFSLNIAVAVTGTLFTNPLTLFFIYGCSLCFGTFILGTDASCYPHGLSKKELFLFMKSMPVPLFTGTIILGSIAALISYYILRHFLTKYRKSKQTQ